MENQGRYVPPRYIPLGHSETEAEIISQNEDAPVHSTSDGPAQWSSGICACCDDMQSCMLSSVLCP